MKFPSHIKRNHTQKITNMLNNKTKYKHMPHRIALVTTAEMNKKSDKQISKHDMYNTHTHMHIHTRLTALCRDYPGEPVPER